MDGQRLSQGTLQPKQHPTAWLKLHACACIVQVGKPAKHAF